MAILNNTYRQTVKGAIIRLINRTTHTVPAIHIPGTKPFVLITTVFLPPFHNPTESPDQHHSNVNEAEDHPQDQKETPPQSQEQQEHYSQSGIISKVLVLPSLPPTQCGRSENYHLGYYFWRLAEKKGRVVVSITEGGGIHVMTQHTFLSLA